MRNLHLGVMSALGVMSLGVMSLGVMSLGVMSGHHDRDNFAPKLFQRQHILGARDFLINCKTRSKNENFDTYWNFESFAASYFKMQGVQRLRDKKKGHNSLQLNGQF